MICDTRVKYLATWLIVFFIGACFLYRGKAVGDETAAVPEMPAHWKVISDFQVPKEQVKEIESNLGADLTFVRNTVYDVNGKRVQINVIVAIDSVNAEKLMRKLRSIKSDEALLRKGLVIYEFVGQNDALYVIAEGRNYLHSK